MKYILFLKMKKREVLIINNIHLDHKEMHQLEKEHQDLRGNQTHPPMEVKVLEEVLEPQEEEEEMNPAILVEMKDQIEMKVPTPKRKKMKVVSLQLG